MEKLEVKFLISEFALYKTERGMLPYFLGKMRLAS